MTGAQKNKTVPKNGHTYRHTNTHKHTHGGIPKEEGGSLGRHQVDNPTPN